MRRNNGKKAVVAAALRALLFSPSSRRPVTRSRLSTPYRNAMSARAESPAIEVTGLLHGWRRGDRGAEERLLGVVYGELQRIARRHLAREEPGHTLQTTALVHE